MRHHILKALGQKPQTCDQATQAEARALFFQHFVKDTDAVVTDPHVAAEKSDIDGLYIGWHDCALMKTEDVFIELWAFSDEPDHDWVGWKFFVHGHEVLVALEFCPFCGIKLGDLIFPND